MSATATLTRPPERHADLLDAMRDLLDPTIAIPESDLADDWLDSVKDAGIPASRYQAMPARLVLRTLESSGDAVREVDRSANGTGIPTTRWGGRGYVPRTAFVAARTAPAPKREPKAKPVRPANIAPQISALPLDHVLREIAQLRAQLQRLESQVEVMARGRA